MGGRREWRTARKDVWWILSLTFLLWCTLSHSGSGFWRPIIHDDDDCDGTSDDDNDMMMMMMM
jgi:hypothetical protein